MSKPRKMAWADMTDDLDPDTDDVVISKRGIKVKIKPAVPNPEPDKKKPPSNSNENDM